MNYYNEFNPRSAAWLRQLIQDGHIPKGEVDERSITEVRADDLSGFTQCHFFAGIGGWSLALRLAGWEASRPVWTGSCPCQPYSCAGKQNGIEDARDLWPVLHSLLKKRRPPVFLGEQVADSVSHGWLDRVENDMEAEDYAVGSVVLGAFSVDAPHKRRRLYVVASDNQCKGGSGLVARQNTGLSRQWGWRGEEDLQSIAQSPLMGGRVWPQPILCRMDDGFPARVASLHGYGNAIVPQVAAEFISAFIEAEQEITP